jgi:hypothetical protein
MIERNYYLPRSGPMPRPKDLAEAVEALRQEAFPAPAIKRVTLHAKEFTAICRAQDSPTSAKVIVRRIICRVGYNRCAGGLHKIYKGTLLTLLS